MENDIGYVPPPGTKVEDTIKIIYKGIFKKKLDFLVQQTRSPAHIHFIRGNLKLHEAQAKNQDDIDHVEQEDDAYETKVVLKSLRRAKKETAQLDHDIVRLQTICCELNVARDAVKTKLMSSVSKTGQLTEHNATYTSVLSKIHRQVKELDDWMQMTNNFTCNDSIAIQKTCSKLKPNLLKVLRVGAQADNGHDYLLNGGIKGQHPDAIIKGLLDATRSVGIKVQAELDRSKDKCVKQNHLSGLLRDLWQHHRDSYMKGCAALKQADLYEQEISRLMNDHLGNIQDESLKRLIKLKQTERQGKAIVTYLRQQIKSMRMEDAQDVVSKNQVTQRYVIVEKQSKEMLGTKLIIEELLGHTSGSRHRVSQFVQQLQQHKVHLVHDFGAELPTALDRNEGLAAEAVHHVHQDHYQKNQESSLDRCTSAKLSQLAPIMGMRYKTNMCHLLQKVLDAKLRKTLLQLYSEEMANLGFGKTLSAHEVLEQLIKAFGKEREDLKELIERKLSSTDNNAGSKMCQEFLHSLSVWSSEPAKDAYIKGIRPCFKGQTLSKWYDDFKCCHS